MNFRLLAGLCEVVHLNGRVALQKLDHLVAQLELELLVGKQHINCDVPRHVVDACIPLMHLLVQNLHEVLVLVDEGVQLNRIQAVIKLQNLLLEAGEHLDEVLLVIRLRFYVLQYLSLVNSVVLK